MVNILLTVTTLRVVLSIASVEGPQPEVWYKVVAGIIAILASRPHNFRGRFSSSCDLQF